MGKTGYSDFDKKKTEKTCKTVLPSEEEKEKNGYGPPCLLSRTSFTQARGQKHGNVRNTWYCNDDWMMTQSFCQNLLEGEKTKKNPLNQKIKKN